VVKTGKMGEWLYSEYVWRGGKTSGARAGKRRRPGIVYLAMVPAQNVLECVE